MVSEKIKLYLCSATDYNATSEFIRFSCAERPCVLSSTNALKRLLTYAPLALLLIL